MNAIDETQELATPQAAEEAAKAALLQRILKDPRIPSPPTLALKVFQMTGQEDCQVGKVSELLAHDPGLCAKILKTLNSAFYGLKRSVSSIRTAVTLLGNRPLRSLVMGLSLPAMQSGVDVDAGTRRFWKKSVTGAIIARELAVRAKWPSPDDDLTASLLRNLGMILIHQTFRAEYQPVWNESGIDGNEDQCAWETQHIGVDHAEVGAALLKQWGLPDEIVEPIRHHHHPDDLHSIEKQVNNRVALLDFVSRLSELEESSNDLERLRHVLRIAEERYGLSPPDLEQFLGTVRPKIQEFSAIMGVDIGAAPDLEQLLAASCEHLVQMSMDIATEEHIAASKDPMMVPTGSRANAPFDGMKTLDFNIPLSNLIENMIKGHANSTGGFRILHYEVDEVVGRGAMGVVLKAFDPDLARRVAIKVLAPEMANCELAQQRFAFEARVGAAIRHQNVVTIFAVSEMDGIPFLVMEYVDGASLQESLDDEIAYTLPQIAQIGHQIAMGLSAAHELRVIHRDIKPANILLEDETNNVRITDFGLARAMDQSFQISQNGILVGTPNFMSPEQVDGKPLTTASDLFSLGSVLYRLGTGQLPFLADSLSGLLHAVAEKTPTPMREINPRIPEGMARVINDLMIKDVNQRPNSAAEIAELLKQWCE